VEIIENKQLSESRAEAYFNVYYLLGDDNTLKEEPFSVLHFIGLHILNPVFIIIPLFAESV